MKLKDKPHFIPLTKADCDELRQLSYEDQEGLCPVVGKVFLLDEMTLDHKHRTPKSTPMGHLGAGLVRGCISRIANSFEGKVASAYVRYGLKNKIDLPTLLRNLANYLENPPLGLQYIHYTEVTKTKLPRLNKNDFNLVVKHWAKIKPKAKALPEYPKSGLMIGEWVEWVAKAKDIKNSK